MRLRNRNFTSALLLSAALTVSLSACGPDEADRSGDKPDSTASASKDQGSSGKDGADASSGGKGNGNSGTGEEGTSDNSRPVAFPLPKGATVGAASSEGKTLEVSFSPDSGSAKDALATYEGQFQRNGYESPNGTWTRGKQIVDLSEDGEFFQVTVTCPEQAPPLPAAPLQDVSSSEDDTLRLTYGLDRNSSDSVSMVKSYVGELAGQGWKVPTDGGTAATKGDRTIEFDSSDPERVTVTIDLPASAG
ncbi:hypothetical protein [Streptomyces sp. NPDC051776]|uniref:hypothetical protein n=1 Tax=Streptomyces sp. NPDC051776 TaxID=3155414 RepID=UPI00341D228A